LDQALARTDKLIDISAMSTGQGSAGNVIAAICSLVFPGLGQLVQGRFLMALVFMVASVTVWIISFGTLGWVAHIWACIDASIWEKK